MSMKIDTESYEDINLLNHFDFESEDDYYKNLKNKNMGIKVHFNDGSTIKGFIVRWNNFHLFLVHKNNIFMVHKGSFKMLEPLPSLEMLNKDQDPK